MSNILKYTLKKDVPFLIKHEDLRKNSHSEIQEERAEEAPILEKYQEYMDGIYQQARDIIDKAGAEAEEMLKQSRQDAEIIKQLAQKEGHEQGYIEGIEDGKNVGYEQMKKMVEESAQKAERILAAAKKQADQMLIDANDEIVRITKAAVQKALCQEAVSNPAVIVDIVKEALDKVRDHEEIVIRLNPEDFEMVLEAKHELQQIIGREHDLNIVADKTVPCGGCIIDTANGSVDAKLDTKLELLLKAIVEVREIEKGKRT